MQNDEVITNPRWRTEPFWKRLWLYPIVMLPNECEIRRAEGESHTDTSLVTKMANFEKSIDGGQPPFWFGPTTGLQNPGVYHKATSTIGRGMRFTEWRSFVFVLALSHFVLRHVWHVSIWHSWLINVETSHSQSPQHDRISIVIFHQIKIFPASSYSSFSVSCSANHAFPVHLLRCDQV